MPTPLPRPPFTLIAPIWRALGVETDKRGHSHYWLEIRSQARRYRSPELCGLGFLAEVYPDMEHWRRMFPAGVGFGINTKAALAYFVKACHDAGAYDPVSAFDADTP